MNMFSQYAISFNRDLLTYPLPKLPKDIKFINPFLDKKVLTLSEQFYQQFYNDSGQRLLILGINPGRHGAGATGIPFTDSKRLMALNINPQGIITHEPSSSFVYQMIEAFGGATAFYQHYYINSPCPLGLIRLNAKKNWVNCNYYDEAPITKALLPLIESNMSKLLQMPIDRERVFCLGLGVNYKVLSRLNTQFSWFKKIIPLPHPRFIIQYKNKAIGAYISQYLQHLKPHSNGN